VGFYLNETRRNQPTAKQLQKVKKKKKKKGKRKK